MRIKQLYGMYKPKYATEDSAGADLYYNGGYSVSIEPSKTAKLGTGIAMEIPKGYVGLIFARSGISVKRGLAPANKVGVIDSDYRGEVVVALHNHSNETETVEPGERIAQIVFVPYAKFGFDVVDELDDTERGKGGFGSTGTK